MKSNLPCVVGISVFLQAIAQDQSSQQINDPGDTKADAYLTLRIENATFTRRVNPTEVAGTTAQANQLENEIELKSDPMNKSDSDFQKTAIQFNLYVECAEEVGGVPPEMMLFLRRGIWDDNNSTLKDWVQCVLVKHKLMSDQGVVRLDVAFKNLTKPQQTLIEENIDKCLPTKRMKPKEISWNFAKCFQKLDPLNSLF